MALADDIQQFNEDATTMHDFVHGTSSGYVDTDSGSVMTLPEAADQVQDFITDAESDILTAVNTYTALNPRGNWATSTSYAVKDLVFESGARYICLSAHTSGTFSIDYSNGYWAVYQGATYSISVSSQTEFNATIIGQSLSNISIYLKIEGSPYLLGGNVYIGSNVKIDSDPGVVIQRNGQYRFEINETSSSSSDYVENVFFTENWTFDGDGGIDSSLGGSTTYTGNGGFMYMDYAKNCVLKCKVTNCSITGSGGGYYIDENCSDLNIANVSYCSAGVSGGGAAGGGSTAEKPLRIELKNFTHNTADEHGGGAYRFYQSKFIGFHYNNVHAGSGGGGVANADRSYFEDFSYNSTTGYDCNGGGCRSCANGTFINFRHNSSERLGGGCYLCHYGAFISFYNNSALGGGGCYSCSWSSFKSFGYNTATTIGGGGCNTCHHSKFESFHHNTSSSGNGGGCDSCDNGSFSDFSDNEADDGGGCYDCNYGSFYGFWDNNTASDSAGYDHISSCTNSIALANSDSGALSQTSQTTINW